MDKQDLYELAVDTLSRRDYSRDRLSRALKKHTQDHALVDEVISKLAAQNYLNDDRIIEQEINKLISKRYGLTRVKQELRKKGFVGAQADTALSNLDTDWFALAAELYEKKFGETPPEDPKDKAKRIRYLQYRGHSMKDIMEIMA